MTPKQTKLVERLKAQVADYQQRYEESGDEKDDVTAVAIERTMWEVIAIDDWPSASFAPSLEQFTPSTS